MRIPLTYPQWLLFWCCVGLALAIMATNAAAGVSDKPAMVPGTPIAAADFTPADFASADFAFAEPYFDTLGQGKSPSPIITALLQDTQGWLWIGTQHGLYRYDGYRMRRFAHDPANPASLTGNNITALWQAADGRLWVGTNSDGVSIFDPQREQFSHLRHDPVRPGSLAGGTVWALAGDARGGVWIGTNEGLDYVEGGAPSYQYRHDPNNPASLLDNQIRSLLIDQQGTLWVGSVGGLQRYRASAPGQRAGFVRVASDPANPASLAGKEVQSLFQARDGKLWLGTHKQGAAWFNPAQTNPTLHWLPVEPQRLDQLSHASVTSIIEAQGGQIWLATYGGGLNVVAAKDGAVLRRLQHDPTHATSLAHDAIRVLIRDHSGMVWLGTAGGGLQRHHPAQRAFKVLRHQPVGPSQLGPRPGGRHQAAGLSHPEVRSVLELANGQILVGTGGNGIDILDRQRGVVGGYRPNQPGGLPDGTIRALLQTPDGTLWAGSQQAGVLRLLPGSRHWQAITEGLPSAHVRKFLLDKDGVLWVATANGIARWQADGQRFVAQQQQDGSALQAYVMTLAEDRQGRLWAASNHGLWLKTQAANGWQPIRHQSGQPNSLPSDDVWVLWVDARDRLWVNSAKGLVRLQQFDGKNAVFEAMSAKAGEQGQGRNGVPWQDRQGRIWLDTARLTQSAPDTVHFADNNRPDIGTPWFGANGVTRDGLLMLGGSQGLAIFDPAQFEPWAFEPPVRLTELTINGKPAAPGAPVSHLRLAPDQRSFGVEFAALDFSQSDASQTRYRYQLQGYDPDWIAADSEHRLAGYGNLWPGSYLLRVQGSNRVGAWSRHELQIRVEVLPAWWQSWWFGLLLLLGLGAGMAGLLQTRTHYLRLRQRALQQLVEDRTSELRRKQGELVAANQELHQSNRALNESNAELAFSMETLRQAQQQLVQQEKMASLGALVVGIAHQINTPLGNTLVALSGVQGAWQTIDQALAGGRLAKSVLESTTREGAEYTALALKTAHRAAELIALFKTIDVNAERDHVATINLADYLADVAALVHARLEQAGCQLAVSAPPDVCIEVVADALTETLERILANTLDHAFAAGRSGSVRLAAQIEPVEGGEEVVITVADDGHGIAAEHLPKVFDPFFTTKSGLHGHIGLGLYVAYNHVTERLKGKIQIDSTLGQGTTVSIRLRKT